MKCPKCGGEILAGSLYCETCGEDIHIVPDFEPEVESSIHESMNGLLLDISEQKTTNDTQKNVFSNLKNQKTNSLKNRIALIVGTAVTTFFLIACIFGGIYLYHHNSLKYQLEKAEQCMNLKEYEKAISYYERALLIDYDNVSVKFLLSDMYYNMGRKNDAVSMLSEVAFSSLEDENVTFEDLMNAYTKIISIYREEENYVAIRDLLNKCDNTDIFTTFQEYAAMEPNYSYDEGQYDSIIPLKLTSTTKGTIYYTLDGSSPTENSNIYTTPIFLESGDYTVSAVFVNQYEIASEVVTKRYYISVLKPDIPEVLLESGKYDHPMMIEIEVPEGYEVYYSTNGEEPTNTSTLYTKPVPLPIGDSSFQFVTFDENGLFSDVVIKNYKLDLNTHLSTQDAIYKLMETLVINGKIYDFNGNSVKKGEKYHYSYQYVMSCNDAGDFYIITEEIEDGSGIRNRTGVNYAVNIYTEECFKIIFKQNGEYVLESF